MKKVTYSRNDINKQTQMKSLKYMRPLEAGTELTVTGIFRGSYDDENGKPVINDSIICRSGSGETIKVSFTDYLKMEVSSGDLFTGDADNDTV